MRFNLIVICNICLLANVLITFQLKVIPDFYYSSNITEQPTLLPVVIIYVEWYGSWKQIAS